MRITLALGLVLLAAPVAAADLPRGDGRFVLGMSRAAVDSALAARGLGLVTDGTAAIVANSDDPRVEYEQYSFFQSPWGGWLLWKVTFGYRLSAGTADFAAVASALEHRLGEPQARSWDPGSSAADDPRPADTTQRMAWGDRQTAVLLGARWIEDPDPFADRMMVTWTDLRLKRLVEARRRKDAKSD